jgi:hypothetical protein
MLYIAGEGYFGEVPQETVQIGAPRSAVVSVKFCKSAGQPDQPSECDVLHRVAEISCNAPEVYRRKKQEAKTNASPPRPNSPASSL